MTPLGENCANLGYFSFTVKHKKRLCKKLFLTQKARLNHQRAFWEKPVNRQSNFNNFQPILHNMTADAGRPDIPRAPQALHARNRS